MNKQLEMGIKVESEHESTYDEILKMVKDGKFPSKKKFFKMIAEDHLKEDKKYYTKLKTLGL